jgi:glucosamine 6-phosphate synthetase-like amidotransferase/phosphosugar isomerase protein
LVEPSPIRISGGINQWTVAEGALNIRETVYMASEGLAVEQFLHGPCACRESRPMALARGVALPVIRP